LLGNMRNIIFEKRHDPMDLQPKRATKDFII
jgi:hypothetical protein